MDSIITMTDFRGVTRTFGLDGKYSPGRLCRHLLCLPGIVFAGWRRARIKKEPSGEITEAAIQNSTPTVYQKQGEASSV